MPDLKTLACCLTPSLTMNWQLGVRPDGSQLLLELNSVRCNACGSIYLFEGSVQRTEDRGRITLGIKSGLVQ
jgi:hypothetical protein